MPKGHHSFDAKLLSLKQAFKRLGSVCKCFLKIEADYKKAISWRLKTNTSRMKSVEKIKDAVNEAYNKYRTDNQNVTVILTELNKKISDINGEINDEHKENGALAPFFKFFERDTKWRRSSTLSSLIQPSLEQSQHDQTQIESPSMQKPT